MADPMDKGSGGDDAPQGVPRDEPAPGLGASDRARFRILIVDDDPLAVRSLVRVLHAGPYVVDTAENVTDALRQAAGHEYAVVITDYKMVGLDGLELCARIRRCTPETQCLLVTAYTDVWTELGDRVRSQFVRVFIKPWDVTKLRAAVGEACEEHRQALARRSLPP
jgi:CheY-like chemotaxis protein